MAAGIALFLALSNNFFFNMYKEIIDVKLLAIDVIASMGMASVVGAVVAVVNGKMK
jgi:hypothetical protein